MAVETELKRGDRWRGCMYFDGGEVRGLKCGVRSVEAEIGIKWVKVNIEGRKGKVSRSIFDHWLKANMTREY